jgi:large subunit ribosomal protein L27
MKIHSDIMKFNIKKYFASKMQASSTQKTKDSAGKRLGIKKLGGNEVFPNDILARQRGFKWHPGLNTYYGKDHTIHSKIEVNQYIKNLKYKKFLIIL